METRSGSGRGRRENRLRLRWSPNESLKLDDLTQVTFAQNQSAVIRYALSFFAEIWARRGRRETIRLHKRGTSLHVSLRVTSSGPIVEGAATTSAQTTTRAQNKHPRSANLIKRASFNSVPAGGRRGSIPERTRASCPVSVQPCGRQAHGGLGHHRNPKPAQSPQSVRELACARFGPGQSPSRPSVARRPD